MAHHTGMSTCVVLLLGFFCGILHYTSSICACQLPVATSSIAVDIIAHAFQCAHVRISQTHIPRRGISWLYCMAFSIRLMIDRMFFQLTSLC